MKCDGERYIRGDDVILWGEQEQGVTYTRQEFSNYWICWMVKPEYEAYVRKRLINKQDVDNFLKDMSWWFNDNFQTGTFNSG